MDNIVKHKLNFHKFLQEKHCFEHFCTNIKFDHGYDFSTFVGGIVEYRNIIDGAFFWERTPEGYAFWRSMNKEWNNTLKGEEVSSQKYKDIWKGEV